MSDPVLELDSGSDVVLLARFGATLGEDDSEAQDCVLPTLLRVLSIPGNMSKLRSNWSVVCSESTRISQLSDDDVLERIVADVAAGRVKAVRREVATFAFAVGKARQRAAAPPPPPLPPKQRVTPSMRVVEPRSPPKKPELPAIETPRPPEPPKLPAVVMPDLPAPPGLLPEPPKLPGVPDVESLKDLAKAGADKLAAIDDVAKARALAEEAIRKGKAAEIARKLIELRNASKEEIAAFAMQMAAEYGDDIPPEYREMLREYGKADKIKEAEKQADKAADTASDIADKF